MYQIRQVSRNWSVGKILPVLFVFVGYAAMPSASHAGEFVVDTNTLFLAHFNKSTDADFANGSPSHSRGTGGLSRGGGGKYGEALVCQTGTVTTPSGDSATYQQMAFSLDDNLDLRKGTLEFWLKCDFSKKAAGPNGLKLFYLFDIPSHLKNQSGNQRRMTVVVREVLEGDGKTKRYFHYFAGMELQSRINSEGVPIEWKAGEWHHVAVTWNDKEAALFLDGAKQGTDSISGGLFGADRSACEGMFWVGGLSNASDAHEGLIDELRISNTLRYGDDFKP